MEKKLRKKFRIEDRTFDFSMILVDFEEEKWADSIILEETDLERDLRLSILDMIKVDIKIEFQRLFEEFVMKIPKKKHRVRVYLNKAPCSQQEEYDIYFDTFGRRFFIAPNINKELSDFIYKNNTKLLNLFACLKYTEE